MKPGPDWRRSGKKNSRAGDSLRPHPCRATPLRRLQVGFDHKTNTSIHHPFRPSASSGCIRNIRANYSVISEIFTSIIRLYPKLITLRRGTANFMPLKLNIPKHAKRFPRRGSITMVPIFGALTTIIFGSSRWGQYDPETQFGFRQFMVLVRKSVPTGDEDSHVFN